MGDVYQAEDTDLNNRIVAIKEMSQVGLTPAELIDAIKLFQQEAHLLSTLNHPNLPDIFAHFESGQRWYLVMKFVDGVSLEEYLQKAPGNHLPTKEVLQIGIQLATALGYLHTRQPQIIFRDLKPSNVMLTPDGHIYLIDFGIARHFKPGQTKDTLIIGTPGYMAPEAYGKVQTTTQSDIYSLGALLHQLLTGNDPSLNTPLLWEFPPLPTTVPPGLTSLIMQMLKVRMNERPASMAAIKQELQRIVDDVATQQKHARQPLVPIQPIVQSPPSLKPTHVLPQPPQVVAKPVQAQPWKKGLAKVLAAPLVVLLLAGLFLVLVPTGKGLPVSKSGGIVTLFPLSGNVACPSEITTGPDGNLWFTAYNFETCATPINLSQIVRITPRGVVTEFPLPTDSMPRGITAGPDGNIWFTETNTDKIGRITPDGVIIEFPIPSGAFPNIGITAGPDGCLWFGEYSTDTIGRITPGGVVTEFPTPSSASSIVAGPDGNIWFIAVGDSGKIGQITPEGRVKEFPIPIFPEDITSGPDGNIWFTGDNTNKIGRITPSGVVTEFSIPATSEYIQPSYITAGPDGNLWFYVDGDSKIGRITPEGTVTEFSTPGLIDSITVGPDGNVWFTKLHPNQIGRITIER